MSHQTLSPLDNRYKNKVITLTKYFSEFNQVEYQVLVECAYLDYLLMNINEIKLLAPRNRFSPLHLASNFNMADFQEIKTIEKKTKHDIKCIEYFIKSRVVDELKSWVHFGLTSQDIIHTARILSIKDVHTKVMIPAFDSIIDSLLYLDHNVKMLARTHGQPAIHTTLDRELSVFKSRLENTGFNDLPFLTKFGGAIGSLQAHYDALPHYNWIELLNEFVRDMLGLDGRENCTTQVSGGETLNKIFTTYVRINNILIDFCQDIWYYNMLGYFKPNNINPEQIGSSTMPQKINPIDFENAEGNLQLANCLFTFFSNKVQISRLQRDLSDSTVLRNIGIAFGHTLLAWKSIFDGLHKIKINHKKIKEDLDSHPEIVLESIQTILRSEGIDDGYELCKDYFRNNDYQITYKGLNKWITSLDVSKEIKYKLTNCLIKYLEN